MLFLFITILLASICIYIGDRIPLKKPLAIILLMNEVLFMVFSIYTGVWHWKWALPLHLCDLAAFFLIINCFKYIPTLFALTYYWGVGGSLQAIATPDLPVNVSHLAAFSFYLRHMGTVIGALYLAFGLKFLLPRYSALSVWIVSHIYALLIFIFNSLLGTNYLFLNDLPDQPSILDYFGPWPYYLIGMEALFIGSLFFLWLLYQILKPDRLLRSNSF